MKFESVELQGFKRMALSGVTNFKFTPTALIQLILGTNGSGKAQPLRSFIKVPGGWDTMRNVKVGSKVIAKDGSTATVTGVFPQGKKDVYKFTFSDGRTAEACADHLWKIYIGGKQYPIVPRIVNTLEVIKWLSMKTYGHLVWVDLIDSEQNEDAELEVDPYVLGVILGDGCISSSVVITNPDVFIADKLRGLLKDDVSVTMRKESKDHDCLTYCLASDSGTKKSNYIMNYFRKCGLIGKRSYDKFIPVEYLHASTKQRFELLNGLMDTDGTINPHGAPSYSSSSIRLAESVQYLVRSLGGIASITVKKPWFTHNGMKKEGALNYQVNIRFKKPSQLFTLPKKKERAIDDGQYCATLKLKILSVEKLSHEETQCISIDHPEHLYVTDNFVVTHNTSLMRELTPLPPDKDDYQNDGASIKHISHHGIDYVLSTHFKGGAEHSFLKDGEELNPGGTVTVQRELVRQEFQITPTIHNLLISNISFTKMGAIQRREWFTLLSDVNYEYAVKLFMKLKENHQYSKGALKLAKKQLVVEVSKTITTEVQSVLTKEIDDMHEILQSLIERRQPVENDSESLEMTRYKTANALKDLAKVMIAKRALFGAKALIETEESLTERLEACRHTQASMGLYTAKLTETIARLDSNIATVERAGTDGSVVLLQAMQDITNAKIVAANNLRNDIVIDNPVYAQEIFDGLQTILVPLLGQLPENADKRYNWNTKKASDEEIFTLKDKLSKAHAALGRIDLVIQHQEKHRDDSKTECPSCHHTWSIGYNEEVYNAHCIGREAVQEEIDDLTEKLVTSQVFNQEVSEYSEIFQEIMRTMNGQPVLKPLWDHILKEALIFSDPRRVIQTLESFRLDLAYLVEIGILNEQYEQKRAQLHLAKESESFNLHEIKEQKASLETELEGLTNNLNAVNSDIKILRSEIQDMVSAKTIALQIQTLYSTYEQTYSGAVETARREALHQVIRSVQVQLSNKEAILSEARMQKGIIDNLEKNIRNLEEQDLVYKALITELSPTDGLIAEGLLGFIRTFTAQMNAFIKKVWAYPLVIHPCGVFDNGKLELDYKFPMMVNTEDNVVPDVSVGSSAMTEITDLAFKIVAMKYLHISDSPLLLDEFSSSFDVAHRAVAASVIKALIEQQPFTQLFMISHVFEQYGAFNNMQVTVLCPNNIVTPKVYNEHVELS